MNQLTDIEKLNKFNLPVLFANKFICEAEDMEEIFEEEDSILMYGIVSKNKLDYEILSKRLLELGCDDIEETIETFRIELNNIDNNEIFIYWDIN